MIKHLKSSGRTEELANMTDATPGLACSCVLWNGVNDESQQVCYQPFSSSHARNKSAAALISRLIVVDIAKDSVKVGEGGEGSWVKVERVQGWCRG